MIKDKEIINKLNKLKKVTAEAEWKTSNRSVLLAQIFSSQPEPARASLRHPLEFFRKWPLPLLSSVSRPLAVAILVVFFLTSAGAAGFIAARESLPGDSLYLAKIVGEKAQLVFTFNDDEKSKLGVQFAANRAEEIAKVLSEPEMEKNEKKVADLVNNFKKEISVIRTRLAKKSPLAVSSEPADRPAPPDEAAQEDNLFFRADSGKNDKGIEISGPPAETKPISAPALIAATSSPAPEAASRETASTTAKEAADPLAILEEAKVLLDKKDYGATLNKLDEADKAMAEQAGIGLVKGEAESATTTEAAAIKDESASSTGQ